MNIKSKFDIGDRVYWWDDGIRTGVVQVVAVYKNNVIRYKFSGWEPSLEERWLEDSPEAVAAAHAVAQVACIERRLEELAGRRKELDAEIRRLRAELRHEMKRVGE